MLHNHCFLAATHLLYIYILLSLGVDSAFVLQLTVTACLYIPLQPCGVDYELKTWVAENEAEKPHKRSTVRLAIRKLTYAPDESAPQPRAEITKDFMMSSGKVKVEASLDKEVRCWFCLRIVYRASGRECLLSFSIHSHLFLKCLAVVSLSVWVLER